LKTRVPEKTIDWRRLSKIDSLRRGLRNVARALGGAVDEGYRQALLARQERWGKG